MESYDIINPSCTKPFGTHVLYQGEIGGSPKPPISKTFALINMKFCMIIKTSLNALEMLKFFYIVINWLS